LFLRKLQLDGAIRVNWRFGKRTQLTQERRAGDLKDNILTEVVLDNTKRGL
jgi:hypothetical protein